MASLLSLVLVKRFTYRGDNAEDWSNRYSFRDPPPGTASEWDAFATTVIGHERAIYPPTTKVVRAYGYADDSEDAQSVWSRDYSLDGSETPGTWTSNGRNMAGDQAACVWWKLDHKSTRNKYVYLRKYFHGGDLSLTNPDDLSDEFKTALFNLADTFALTVGGIGGGLRARTGTWAVIDKGVIPYSTTRTLKRRGERPLSPAKISRALAMEQAQPATSSSPTTT